MEGGIMSQKKRKKGKNQNYRTGAVTGWDSGSTLEHENGKVRRLSPDSRNLLLLDLVLLAVTQMLFNAEKISEAMANILSLIGLALLILALVRQFQYTKKSGNSGSSGKRL